MLVTKCLVWAKDLSNYPILVVPSHFHAYVLRKKVNLCIHQYHAKRQEKQLLRRHQWVSFRIYYRWWRMQIEPISSSIRGVSNPPAQIRGASKYLTAGQIIRRDAASSWSAEGSTRGSCSRVALATIGVKTLDVWIELAHRMWNAEACFLNYEVRSTIFLRF